MDISQATATGPDGRIVAADVQKLVSEGGGKAQQKGAPAQAASQDQVSVFTFRQSIRYVTNIRVGPTLLVLTLSRTQLTRCRRSHHVMYNDQVRFHVGSAQLSSAHLSSAPTLLKCNWPCSWWASGVIMTQGRNCSLVACKHAVKQKQGVWSQVRCIGLRHAGTILGRRP